MPASKARHATVIDSGERHLSESCCCTGHCQDGLTVMTEDILGFEIVQAVQERLFDHWNLAPGFGSLDTIGQTLDPVVDDNELDLL